MAKEREEVTIRMPKADKQAFNALCNEENRTFSERVILWLHEAIWQQQKQKRQEEQSV